MDIEWSARETEIYGCLDFLDLWVSLFLCQLSHGQVASSFRWFFSMTYFAQPLSILQDWQDLPRWSVPLGAKHEAVGTFGGWPRRRKMEDGNAGGTGWHGIFLTWRWNSITRMSYRSLFAKTRLSLWIATFFWGSFSSKSEIYIRCYTNCLTKILLDPKSNHFTRWNPLRQGSSSQWSMVPCVQLARARQRIPWVYGPWTRRRRFVSRVFTRKPWKVVKFFSFWGVIC